MKNMEKYPNTANALEAYAAYRKTEGLPFEEWLAREYVAPREPTLLEAAEAIVNTVEMPSDPQEQKHCDDLIAAIDREKRKPVRNCDRYKTAEEAMNAYYAMCSDRPCALCNFFTAKSRERCTMAWLYAEADAADAAWNRRPLDGHTCGECANFCAETKRCGSIRECVGEWDTACCDFKKTESEEAK